MSMAVRMLVSMFITLCLSGCSAWRVVCKLLELDGATNVDGELKLSV